MKRFLLSFTVLLVLAGMVFATGTQEKNAAAGSYKIRHMPFEFYPSQNKTPTPEQPIVTSALDKLARDFEKKFPEVKVEFVASPPQGQNVDDFLRTRALSKELPEVLGYANRYATEVEPSWFLPLEKEIEKPNEFVPGNKKWKDLWRDSGKGIDFDLAQYEAAGKAAGHLLSIGYEASVSGYGYIANMDILKAVGISTDNWPRDFVDWEVYAKKIKAAGYEVLNDSHDRVRIYGPSSLSMMKKVIVLKYSQPDRWDKTKPAPATMMATPEEWVRAVEKGYFLSADPIMQGYFEWLKREGDYYFKGEHTKASDDTRLRLWKAGKLAFTGAYTWNVLSMLGGDIERKFDIKAVPRHYVGPKSTPTADPNFKPGATGGLGGMQQNIGGSLGLTVSANKDPKLYDYCVKWLMWLGVPENNALWINENPGGAPIAKGTPAHPALGAFENVSMLPLVYDGPEFPKPVYATNPLCDTSVDHEFEVYMFGGDSPWMNYTVGNMGKEEFNKLWDENVKNAAGRITKAEGSTFQKDKW